VLLSQACETKKKYTQLRMFSLTTSGNNKRFRANGFVGHQARLRAEFPGPFRPGRSRKKARSRQKSAAKNRAPKARWQHHDNPTAPPARCFSCGRKPMGGPQPVAVSGRFGGAVRGGSISGGFASGAPSEDPGPDFGSGRARVARPPFPPGHRKLNGKKRKEIRGPTPPNCQGD